MNELTNIEKALSKKIFECLAVFTIIVILLWILFYVNVLPGNTTISTFTLIASIFLLVGTLIYTHYKSSSPKTKYIILTVNMLVCALIYTAFNNHVILLFAFPMFLLQLYNSKRLLIYTDIFTLVVLFISTIGSVFLQESFNETGKAFIEIFKLFVPGLLQMIAFLLISNIVFNKTQSLISSNISSNEQINFREKVLDNMITKNQYLSSATNLFDLHKYMKESLIDVISSYTNDNIIFHMGMISNNFYFNLDTIDSYQKGKIENKKITIKCQGFDYELKIDDIKDSVIINDNYVIIKLYDNKKLNYFMLVEAKINVLDHSLESSLKILQKSMETSTNNLLLGFTLQTSQKEMIYAIAQVSESRSHQTGAHIIRVADYMKVLCKEAGYTDEEAEKIRIASMLHDVGKLYIPTEILDKKGRLTDAEFEIMKKHVTLGAQLISKCPGDVMEYARMMVREHHERYDGQGYLKMKGKDISYPAKLIAVADVFDALISKRSYKTEWDPKEAYDLIVSESGTHFDPDCVEIFKKCFLELVFIHRNNPDRFKD